MIAFGHHTTSVITAFATTILIANVTFYATATSFDVTTTPFDNTALYATKTPLVRARTTKI